MSEELEKTELNREFTFFELVNRYYKYGNWITNISMSLLGFYIAILLHYKSINQAIIIYLAVPIVVLLIVSVGIGIYLKMKYDVKYKHDVLYKNAQKFIDKKHIKAADLFYDLHSVFKHQPKPFVILQFWLVSIALIVIFGDLVRYFFFT